MKILDFETKEIRFQLQRSFSMNLLFRTFIASSIWLHSYSRDCHDYGSVKTCDSGNLCLIEISTNASNKKELFSTEMKSIQACTLPKPLGCIILWCETELFYVRCVCDTDRCNVITDIITEKVIEARTPFRRAFEIKERANLKAHSLDVLEDVNESLEEARRDLTTSNLDLVARMETPSPINEESDNDSDTDTLVFWCEAEEEERAGILHDSEMGSCEALYPFTLKEAFLSMPWCKVSSDRQEYNMEPEKVDDSWYDGLEVEYVPEETTSCSDWDDFQDEELPILTE